VFEEYNRTKYPLALSLMVRGFSLRRAGEGTLKTDPRADYTAWIRLFKIREQKEIDRV